MTDMPLITDLFSLEDLQAEIDAGYVKIRQHPTAPLSIANYTNSAQYDHRWNNVTRQTRGLIYNTETLEIVARPWAKFFNVDQVETPTPAQGAAMIRAPKFDGSLGVLYFDPTSEDWAIATRGSFTSDQAIHATKLLRSILDAEADNDMDTHDFIEGEFSNPFRTYLFEVIYKDNRIVVDYGDRDELVLLDVVDNETGKSDLAAFDSLVWDSKAEKTLIPGGFYDTIFADIPEGEEGFVLYWPHTGVRAKVKSARYIELHRIVFGLSEKSIWQMVMDGKTIDQIKEDLPDELFGFVDETFKKLTLQRLAIYNDVIDAWVEITGSDIDNEWNTPRLMDRKEFAAKAVQYKSVSKFLFKILDGADDKVINNMIWKDLKPVGQTQAKFQSEDVA